MHDLTELIDDLPTEALELYVAEWEGPGVGGYFGASAPMRLWPDPGHCRCPRASLGFMPSVMRADSRIHLEGSGHPADIIEAMAKAQALDTEALYRACKAAILARDASVERVREEVRVG